MKNIGRGLVATGVALVLSGGIASAMILSNGAAASTSVAASSGAVGTELAALIGGRANGSDLADKDGPRGADLITAAATYIGIPVADIRTQLAAGKSLSDIAIANGKTRDGLVSALVAASQQRISTFVDQKGLTGPGGFGGRGHKGENGPRGFSGGSEAAAATYLGVTRADLETKTDAGQSLSAIANASPGKSRDGLIQALVADATAKIEAAKTAGTLTAAQATQLESTLLARITADVDKVEAAGH